jgi:hypothetical protein
MLTETKPERVPLQVGWAVPAGWAAPAGSVRTRWEYLSLHTDGDAETITALHGIAPHIGSRASITAALETLGAEDWELVSVAPRGSGGFLYVFKRPAMKH